MNRFRDKAWWQQFGVSRLFCSSATNSQNWTDSLQVCAIYGSLLWCDRVWKWCSVWLVRRMPCVCWQESEGDSDDMWDRSSESESSSSDEEVRPLGTLTADFFRKKLVSKAPLIVKHNRTTLWQIISVYCLRSLFDPPLEMKQYNMYFSVVKLNNR